MPQQLWATCSSVLIILIEKKFSFCIQSKFLCSNLLSTASLSVPVHLGAEAGSVLYSPLSGCIVFLRLDKLSSLLLSFQVMNLQSSRWLSTGLVPIWQCVFCVEETTTGHNTPDGVSQVFSIWKGSVPWSYWQQLDLFAGRVQLTQHIHQLIFLGTASYLISTVHVVISSPKSLMKTLYHKG